MIKSEEEEIQQLSANIATKKHLKRVRNHYQHPRMIQPKPIFVKTEQQQQIQALDVSDMLKTISHQKKVMNSGRWKQMMNIHQHAKKPQLDYKFFLMISSQANYRKLDHPGYYKQLTKQIPVYPTVFFSCIEKDIPRTLPDTHPFQNNLRNLLYCYAIRNPSLLYCQGMNYIAAFLLMNSFSEEEAFWLLTQLIEDIVMSDYFKDLSTISITSEIFTHVLKEVFPQLAQQMEEVSMDSSIFLVGWYICLFTKGFINSVSQYLLEKIVLETRKYSIGFVLLKISLGIMAALLTGQLPLQFEKDFRALKETIEKNVYQISLEEIRKGIDYLQFDYQSYKNLEKIYLRRNEKSHEELLRKQLQQKKLSLPLCNINDQVCLQRVEIQKKIGTIEQVLILKPKTSLSNLIIKNYFPNDAERNNNWFHYSDISQCPITHQTHICNYDKQLTEKFLRPTQFDVQKSHYRPITEIVSGEERMSQRTKMEDIYNEYSQFFVLSDEQEIIEVDTLEIEQSKDIRIHTQQKFSQEPKGLDYHPFLASINSVFKKAVSGIKLLRKKSQLDQIQ